MSHNPAVGGMMSDPREASPFDRGSSEGMRVHARSAAAVLGLLVLGAVLRFVLIGHHSLFFDEAYIAWLCLHPWPDVFRLLRFAELHPPLYYVLTKLWIGLAGPGETALRTPSAVFGSASIVLTYFLVRRVASETVSLLSALFVAVSPFEIIAGQTAKMYTLLEVLVLGATLVLANALERSTVRRWSAYAILAAAILYTHYLGPFILLAHGVWVWCRRRGSLKWWLASLATAGLLFAPWVPSLLVQLSRESVSPGLGEPGLLWNTEGLIALFAFGGSLRGAPGYWYMNTSLPFAGLLALASPFLVVFAAGVYAARRNRDLLVQAGLPMLIVLGSTYLLSIRKPFFFPRWFSFLFPFYGALLANGVAAIGDQLRTRRQPVTALVSIGLLAYTAPVLERQYLDPTFGDQWRSAAGIVAEQFQSGDLMLFGDPQNELVFTYYFGGRHPGMILAIGNHYFGGAVPVPRLAGQPGVPVALPQLARQYRRVWLVVAPPFKPEMLRRTLAALRGPDVLAQEIRFPTAPGAPVGIYPLVYQFVAKGQTAP